MAQFGSTINPALGRADYSPLLQGAGAGAQGIMQGAQGMAQGISKGFELFQRNKEEEKMANATIKSSESLIKGLKALADQKDEKGNAVVPAQISAALDQFAVQVSDPSISTRERAMLAKQGMQQFSGLIDAGIKGSQIRASLEQSQAQTNLVGQQASALASELQRSNSDNAALAKAISAVSEGKSGDVLGSFIAMGGSIEGASKLKPFLPAAKEAPAGYRFTASGNQEIIPGGPAAVASQEKAESNRREQERLNLEKERVDLSKRAEEVKIKEEEDKKKSKEDSVKALYEQGKVKAGVMLENIQRAKQLVESGWTQGAGSTTFGWTPTAASLEAAYTNIGGNTALETIMEAKKASPSGGSPFGPLSQKELEVAMGSKGVLNRQITEEDAKTNLGRIEKLLLQAYPELKDQVKASKKASSSAPKNPSLPPGWGFTQ